MLQPRFSQISLVDTPYFMNNIPVIRFFEAITPSGQLAWARV
jgi:hypothetical protein